MLKSIMAILILSQTLNADTDLVTYDPKSITVDGKLVYVWPPDTSALRPPYSPEIKTIKKKPEEHFREKATKAARDFQGFAKIFRNCIKDKSYVDRKKCLERIDFCKESSSCFAILDNPGPNTRIDCGTYDLKKCVGANEYNFNAFSKCFEENIELGVRFILNNKKQTETYYMLKSHHSFINKEGGTEEMACEFSVKGDAYKLVEISNGIHLDNAPYPR